ncbi:MAG: Inner-membrane translocator [Caldanaerobacter subterraneus]|uniref:Nucleoside ABC transporter membrane protein n=2 Tax=Caldanaerobacter subterraneus TaxID=911092 RepID=A0A101E578_9THEO|nr:ABC transporter permease [Caldanaerobacter sp.]KUK09043.1 MAG: Inner-membrane translocator [Caldanaerobacter subterraneus]MDI3518800.1 ral nucleoside transport system permease protein [Caldanaerobacter sp.]MDK2793731.1 ral nucleoside transport system permease protein [Caldanaerobacter sp.]TCO63255.1 nucleoside ABC transporter membrane protein [Caldanaerobacter subterraneus]HBT50201.1 sugar ABC transporter permease [Caldanaerobacter subterraneus]
MKKNYKILTLKILAPFIAIFLAAFFSSFVILTINKSPLEVFYTMFKFSFRRLDSIAIILYNSTPLIFSGLAVAIAFRMGLFNIGVEGQYLIGTFLAAFVGFSLEGLPPFIHIPLLILSGMLGGMIWAYLPIYLKIRKGVHEVISTIMLNYIAYSLIHYLISEIFIDRSQKLLIRTPKLAPSALMPKLHGVLALFGIELPKHVYLNWFFVIAVLLAIAIYYIVYYTPFGFELRAVGQNPEASRTAGIDKEKVFYKGFLLSGAIAGLVGLSDLMSYFGYMDLDFPRGYGFDGIAVALIGQNDPFGIILASILFGFLRRGAEGIQTLLNVPMDTIVILQALMIITIVIINKIVGDYIKRLEKKGAR